MNEEELITNKHLVYQSVKLGETLGRRRCSYFSTKFSAGPNHEAVFLSGTEFRKEISILFPRLGAEQAADRGTGVALAAAAALIINI